MMIRKNEFHNSTTGIMIDGYYPDNQNLAVSFGKYPTQKVNMRLIEITRVYDVVETSQSQELCKYFLIVKRKKGSTI